MSNENTTTKNALSFRPLRADEIEARVSTVSEKGVSILLYKDARCDMQILDETVGPENWKKSYTLIGQELFCSLSIRVHDEWIEKQDAGEYTDRTLRSIEYATKNGKPIVSPSLVPNEPKSRASDAQKRAAFAWGIGRELYTAPFIWVPADKANITKDRNGNATCNTRFSVSEIAYDEHRRIYYLVVVDAKTKKPVFTWGEKPAPDMLPTLTKKLNETGIPEKFVLDAFKVEKLTEIAPEKIVKMCSEENFAKLASSYKKKLTARAEALGLTDEALAKKYGRGIDALTIKEITAAIATAEAA